MPATLLPYLALLMVAGRETPSLSVPRLPRDVAPPRIDADLTDPSWEHAALLGDLTQVEPLQGAVPSERTEVRLLSAADGLFLSLRCFDSEPAGIRATEMRRDANLDPDDRVEFLLDTFHDHRNAFWFQIGPGGSKGDALIDGNGSSFNKQWDGIWYGRARITAEGWCAEVKIPAATLNFDPEKDRWGFNLRRFIRRRNEEVRWASALQRVQFFSIADSGDLLGLSGMHQGFGLDVAPFVVGDHVRDRGRGRRLTSGDVGVDAFYKVTPNLKLSLSFNTDFAETEVDERQVNLSRFPLFFPEKRDFFLEDSGHFLFGPARGGVLPFFSRRVGLDDSGNEVSLLAAAKATGRAGGFNVGVLDVQTEGRSHLGSKNLMVARISHNLWEQSDAGVIVTHGNPTADPRSTTYGADFNYRTSDFLGRNLRLASYLLRSDTEGMREEDLAYSLAVDYPNDEIDLGASYTVVEKNFDPALGFVSRAAMKQYDLELGWQPRLPGSFVRQLGFGFFPQVITDPGNQLETLHLVVRPLTVDFESGDEIGAEIRRTHEDLDSGFDIQRGVHIPADHHRFTRYRAFLESDDGRPLSLEGEYEFGHFFGGRRTDAAIRVDARPSAYTIFGVDLERNDVRLPGGNFVVRIARVRTSLVFTPELTWSNFVQYDNLSDDLGLNSRVWWIVAPGHDVFLVLHQGWVYERDLVSRSTRLSAKVGYTFRF